MDDQTDIRFIKIENYSSENRQNIQSLQDEVKALHIKIGEQNTQILLLKNLLDRYFTMELDHIKESHEKRKV